MCAHPCFVVAVGLFPVKTSVVFVCVFFLSRKASYNGCLDPITVWPGGFPGHTVQAICPRLETFQAVAKRTFGFVVVGKRLSPAHTSVVSPDCFLLVCSPMVQFQLLHSKYHLCSPNTRGLLLSTYIKFINLFPEIKQNIQDVSILVCVLSGNVLSVSMWGLFFCQCVLVSV